MTAAAVAQNIHELNQGQPVIILLTLSRAFFRPAAHGVIHPATGEAPEPERRHAVVAVGYGKVDGHRTILVRRLE